MDGDDLYINSENENKIFKINTLAQTPTLELVLNLYRSYLFISNDKLYTNFSSIFASNVAQCNITNTLPLSLSGFVTLPDNYVVRGIAVKSSTLYFVTSNISGLFKIDLTQTPFTATEISINGLINPSEIGFIGDNLYIADKSANKIFKYNINQTSTTLETVVDGMDISGAIAFLGNDLYYMSDNNKLLKKDLTLTTNTPQQVLIFDNSVQDIVIKNNGNLFASMGSQNKIVKVNLDTLSLSDFFLNTINVYPIPASNFVNITSYIAIKRFDIINILGKTELSGSLINSKINVDSLRPGVYFVKLYTNKTAFKVRKIVVN